MFVELSEGVDGILYAEEIGGEVGFGNSAGKWRLVVVEAGTSGRDHISLCRVSSMLISASARVVP